MHQPRKIGGPQLSCNNNFMRAISAILPEAQSEKQGLLFKEWIPLALVKPDYAENTNSAGNQHVENNEEKKRTHPMQCHCYTLPLLQPSICLPPCTHGPHTTQPRTLDTINHISTIIIIILLLLLLLLLLPTTLYIHHLGISLHRIDYQTITH